MITIISQGPVGLPGIKGNDGPVGVPGIEGLPGPKGIEGVAGNKVCRGHNIICLSLTLYRYKRVKKLVSNISFVAIA